MTVTHDANWNLTGKFTISATPCSGYAEVYVQNPGRTFSQPKAGQSASGYYFNAGALTAVTEAFDMGFDDGDYHLEGRWVVQDDTITPPNVRYYPADETEPADPTKLATTTQDVTVHGFVQLTNAIWNPASAQFPASSDLALTAIGSNHCTGTAQVRATIDAYPPGTIWTFGGQSGNTAYANITLSQGGNTGDTKIHITASGVNPGTIKATTALTANLPANCAAKTQLATAASLSVTR